MPPYSMPVCSTATSTAANEALRTSSWRRTSPLTSALVVASTTQAANLVSPSRRPAITTQLADSSSGTPYRSQKAAVSASAGVDLRDAHGVGGQLPVQRRERLGDGGRQQVGPAQGGHRVQAADAHAHAASLWNPGPGPAQARRRGRKVPTMSVHESLGENIGGSSVTAGGATIAALGRALDAGELTSAALTAFYLDRIERLNPGLHAVITVSPDAAEQAASDATRPAGPRAARSRASRC